MNDDEKEGRDDDDDDVVVNVGFGFGWEKDDVSITGIGLVSDSFALFAVASWSCICYSRAH